MEGDRRLEKQPVLSVEFTSEKTVRIARRGSFFGLGLGGGESVEIAFEPGRRIDFEGIGLWLEPEEDLVGETFWLRSLQLADAVGRVMEHTHISETQRNSGVVRVTFEDSDPERAAWVTNELCSLYIRRNKERNERRASQTVHFIESQLEEQIQALEEAELEVVQLQRDNPHSVDVGASGQALIEQLAGLEVEEVQLRLVLAGLQETLERLDKGDVDALSRLDNELTDPITRSYLQRIAELTTEAELLSRSDTGAFKGLLQAKSLELRAEDEAIGVQIASLQATMDALEGGEPGALGRLVTMERKGGQDPLMHAYIERWTAYETRLRELQVEFTDELPEIGTLRQEIGQLEERVKSSLAGRLQGYRTQRQEYAELLGTYEGRVQDLPEGERVKISVALDSLRERTALHLTGRLTGLYGRLSRLEEEQATLEGSLAQLPEEVRVLADPMRRREAHAEIVKFLLARQKEAEIARASTVASAEFIDGAVPPRHPRGPFLPGYLLGGLCAGLAAAFALVFVRQSLDRGIHTTEELEAASGLTLFGAIPDYKHGKCRVRGAKDSFVALRDDPEGPIAEAYRSLRSTLKFVLNSGQGDLEIKTLAFTSCTQNEGKSVTNADMALAFAMSGKRVLLVDADMRRPSAHRYLPADRNPGLSEVLTGDKEWRACVQAGIRQRLDLLPAGRQPRSPGDLLAGAVTARFIAEVREAYDLVIFDVPPVLAVADIDCLAAQLDGLLLVVRAGQLSGKVVEDGMRRLDQMGANLIGCVLNAARPRRREQKYGYGYGYGYGAKPQEAA